MKTKLKFEFVRLTQIRELAHILKIIKIITYTLLQLYLTYSQQY